MLPSRLKRGASPRRQGSLSCVLPTLRRQGLRLDRPDVRLLSPCYSMSVRSQNNSPAVTTRKIRYVHALILVTTHTSFMLLLAIRQNIGAFDVDGSKLYPWSTHAPKHTTHTQPLAPCCSFFLVPLSSHS